MRFCLFNLLFLPSPPPPPFSFTVVSSMAHFMQHMNVIQVPLCMLPREFSSSQIFFCVLLILHNALSLWVCNDNFINYANVIISNICDVCLCVNVESLFLLYICLKLFKNKCLKRIWCECERVFAQMKNFKTTLAKSFSSALRVFFRSSKIWNFNINCNASHSFDVSVCVCVCISGTLPSLCFYARNLYF